ncbi:MAG: Do family serine endopeptidase [Treponema sp.]|jgi:Do/DeqQ family serine protease|nr:Do family serine endopeptidase [Treponema sp.]
MNVIQKLSSKNLLIFNLVLIGAIFGFSLAFLSFSCSTPTARLHGKHAMAQQNSISIPQDALAAAEGLQTVFHAVSEKVLPSVVEVKTVSVRRHQLPNIPGIPWDFFFGPRDRERGPNNGQEREYRSQSLGSGIIVRNINGVYYALTNNHVVEGASEIRVATKDGQEYPAELVGKDERKDLAMISFKTDDVYPLAVLGDSDRVAVGHWAIAMGNPLGEQFSFSVTLGIVSAVGRTGGPGGNINDFIQTDAPINQGNSGGPLVNIRGEVIGINTWIASNTSGGGNVGLGFAIPINNAKRSIDEFITTGSTSYGWLGVLLSDPGRETIASMGLEGKRGALASQVFIGSPADKGGIKPGDFVTHVNGRETRGSNQLTMMVGDLKPNDTAVFSIIRDKRTMEIRVRIEARTDQVSSDNRKLWPGVTVVPLNDQMRESLELDKNAQGLYVAQIVSGGPADIMGLRRGDRITSVNGENVRDIGEFFKALREKTDREMWFGIIRGESSLETMKYKK